jgi:hypothetical protein
MKKHTQTGSVWQRRRWLQWGGGWAGLLGLGHPAAWGQQAVPAESAPPATAKEPPRLALLIGNREYPDGDDLPPIHKNVRDLRAVLEKRGFTVTEGLDLDYAQAIALMQTFVAQVRAAPPEATVFFYFSGHGAQVDAENLLVSARLSPKARPDALMKGSMTLTRDVVSLLPHRQEGLTIAVIDACRTSVRDVARGEGLNQVEAPPGCLIAFATGAGKPAIAPTEETRNTFYTASLVKLLAQASDEITFSDMFRLVKYDVQDTMKGIEIIKKLDLVQQPFIAENTKVARRLAPQAETQVAAAPAPPRFRNLDEAADWRQLEAAVWPGDVARLAREFLGNHAQSRLAGSARVALEGAKEAAAILRRKDVKLFPSAFQPGQATELGELLKAGRGDKDAAARLGRVQARDNTPAGIDRYEGWLQYAAALGNGIASYELALHYRRVAQPLLAAQFEARARELGYTPPPSLDSSRK